MKKGTFFLVIISVLLMLVHGCGGCGGGSSGGSSNSSSSAASINKAPVADAGDDQSVAVGESAVLSGSSSYDPDEDYPITYEWQIVSTPEGSAATLSEIVAAGGSDSSQISITPDLSGDYAIQLVVTDSKGLASESDLVVVSTQNSAPKANAGPDQTAQINDLVTLDGGGSSDVDGDSLTYSWTLIIMPDGSTASLSDPTAVNPSFVFDASGIYVAELIVNDGLVDSVPDTININWINSSPVADAGTDQTAQIDDLVTLDGGGSSDVDGDSLTYSWTLIMVPDGSTASLSDPTAVNPSFVVDVSGTYVAQLIVNDGLVDSAPDTVTINWENSPPVADAGTDQTAQTNDLVTLDGSGSSDVDGDILSFFWTLITVPDGSSALLSDPTAVSPSFVVDVSGTYVAQLIVNDGMVDSAADTVAINHENSPPVADAGPDQAFSSAGTTIQLDGSQSFDPDGDPLTYAWHIISKPPPSTTTLSDANSSNPTFVADSLGTYILQLVVTDDLGATSDPAQVVVSSGNVRPVADAGVNQIVLVLDTAYLDGSGSYDANNDPLTYNWYFSSKPKKSSTELFDYTLVNPWFKPDAEGEYITSLIVNDGSLDSHSSSVTVLAVDAANLDCFIQALWDALNAINSLDDEDFSNENNRNALTNKIISLLINYLKGSYGSNLVEVLRNDIGDKMDGCASDQQAPEETDWITNCPAQDEVYQHIELAIYIIENDPLCEQ
jgi:hypothetical protein